MLFKRFGVAWSIFLKMPLLDEFPTGGLEGSSVVLASFERRDITDFYIDWLNDKEVVKYSNQRFINHTHSSCSVYYESFLHSDNLFLKVLDKSDGTFIGTVTCFYAVPHFTVDVGILIGDKSRWGQGIGTDSWLTVIDWLRTRSCVRKITAGALDQNLAMINLFNKAGMELEAVREKQEYFEGQARDLLFFRLFT